MADIDRYGESSGRRLREGSTDGDPKYINEADYLYNTTDVFGKRIADGTSNELDIASHYPYSPERWKIYVDGTRVFPEYDTVSQYTHDVDVHKITPADGETVIFETAELPRYVVQYEQEMSFAVGINRALESGDSVKAGAFNDDDGWYLEHNGSHGAKQCDLVIRRDGSAVKTRSNLTLEKPLTQFARYSNRYSWYNVGPALWKQFYTSGNEGTLHEIGSIAVDSGRGPQKGNLPIRFEITSASSGLEVYCGSVGLVTLGNANHITRVKGADFTDNVGSTDTYVPLRAFRINPRTDIVNVQITSLDALNYSSDDELRLLASVMPSEKTTFGTDGWSTPPEWLADNNALQTRTDITGISDATGSVAASATDPGGYQVGRSILIPVSGQFQKGIVEGGEQTQKRGVASQDYIIVLGKSGTTGDVTYEMITEQSW